MPNPRVGGIFSRLGALAGLDIGGGLQRQADSTVLEPFPHRNALINGSFQIAQRGTSFTAATTPLNSDDTYLLDRWVLLSDGNDRADITQETSVVPTGTYAAIKFDVETVTAAPNSEKMGIVQIIETRNCQHLIGGTASLSFKARTTSGQVENLRAAVLSWDSTADSPTSDLVGASWNAEGSNPDVATNWTAENTAANLVLTNVYQTFKIEGISIDTASTNNVAVFIWVDDTDLAAADVFYIADVQLELGSFATDYETRTFQEELEASRRYYVKTFDYGVAPAQNTGDRSGVVTLDVSGTAGQINWRYATEMRATPTLTTFNPDSANANWRDDADANDRTATTPYIGTSSTSVAVASATDATTHHIHATAEAEL